MVIFISYRRDDSQYIADRIYEYLVRKFGLEGVFKDLDSIPLGQDFSEVIKTKVGQCDVLLAVIGDKWLAAANPEGKRRIDDPGDWVRLEIEAALDRKVPVIPLLVNGAVMPRGEQLPASVGPLANRNGMPVRPNPDFPHDMERLI